MSWRGVRRGTRDRHGSLRGPASGLQRPVPTFLRSSVGLCCRGQLSVLVSPTTPVGTVRSSHTGAHTPGLPLPGEHVPSPLLYLSRLSLHPASSMKPSQTLHRALHSPPSHASKPLNTHLAPTEEAQGQGWAPGESRVPAIQPDREQSNSDGLTWVPQRAGAVGKVWWPEGHQDEAT